MSSRRWSLATRRRYVFRFWLRQTRLPGRIHQDTELPELDQEDDLQRRRGAAVKLACVNTDDVNMYKALSEDAFFLVFLM